jgi:hypothetical protein
VAEVSAVTNVNVFENTTTVTDASGLPPNSFECVVLGGTDLAVATAILQRKPVGVATYGTTTQAVVSGLATYDVKFSRPTTVVGYVTVSVRARGTAPADLADVIKAAIVAFADDRLTVGSPMISAAFVPSIFAAHASIIDVPSVFIGTAPAPTLPTTITPTNRQIINVDTSGVVVNLTIV